MTLRLLSDIDRLTSWRAEVIETVFGIPADDALLAANTDYYRRALSDGTHVAIEALSPVGEGLGCGSICLQEELPSPDNPSGRCACLMNIYVRQEARRQGVGARIVESLIDEARRRGCGKIYLETTPAGRNLYARHGFADLHDMMILR